MVKVKIREMKMERNHNVALYLDVIVLIFPPLNSFTNAYSNNKDILILLFLKENVYFFHFQTFIT